MHNGDLKFYDVIILGAGAAGLMCAIEAGKRRRSVLVIERNERVGKKIRISGGGRCNFTNIHATDADYISHNPHFSKSALSRFTPEDCIRLVEKNKVAYHEKKLGQLFCDHSAQQIIDLLVNECRVHGVTLLLNTNVTQIQKDDLFTLKAGTKTFRCESLVVATGGLSIPPLGVSDLGYKIAQQFKLKISPTTPGLVPLTFSEKDRAVFSGLSGVSLDVAVTFGKTVFRENILFTHKGLSGPAILQISSSLNEVVKTIQSVKTF